jgi:hypothetical protein
MVKLYFLVKRNSLKQLIIIFNVILVIRRVDDVFFI